MPFLKSQHQKTNALHCTEILDTWSLHFLSPGSSADSTVCTKSLRILSIYPQARCYMNRVTPSLLYICAQFYSRYTKFYLGQLSTAFPNEQPLSFAWLVEIARKWEDLKRQEAKVY